jgi:predicted transposase YbfD/YdcC
VENRLHWVLNVVMNEDQIRSRRDNSPYNLAILRHMALNLMHKIVRTFRYAANLISPPGATISL